MMYCYTHCVSKTWFPVRLDKFSRGSAVTQTVLSGLIIYPLVAYFL